MTKPNIGKAYSSVYKRIAKVDHDIRLYRVKNTLLCLLGEQQKAQHLKKLEAQLTSELSKKLQSPLVIDALLDELEARLER